jgi:phosphatidate cytidylyltransferase
MGAVLVAMAVGVLVADQRLAPWYPFLLVIIGTLAMLACRELQQLLPAAARPPAGLIYGWVLALIVANWPARMAGSASSLDVDPWHWVLAVFAAGVLAAFLVEMARFEEPGQAVIRLGMAVLVASYLGLLPSFFAQLRWLEGKSPAQGSVALALAIFTPKCGDIGAYFTGRFFGRHPMAPVLSPKKTWEGAVGGMIASVVAAALINRLGPVLPGGLLAEAGFGMTVGLAGMLGDLAESLIKRDLVVKDASKTVPGFGGVLDVIDSVVFAAPVAYCWLR